MGPTRGVLARGRGVPMTRRICAWCKTDLGPATFDAGGRTHTICDECAAKMLADCGLEPARVLRYAHTRIRSNDDDGS